MYSRSHRHRPQTAASDQQQIYDHLLDCVRSQSPEQILKRFHDLFVSGLCYPDPEIRAALNRILTSASVKDTFDPFLNRCCYILVNTWQTQPLHRNAITQLVDQLGQVSATTASLNRTQATTRLRFLVHQFTQSPSYQKLRRLSDLLNPSAESAANQPLGQMLGRYHYLYQHCLTTQQDSQEHQQTIRKYQTQAKQKFEKNLYNYTAQAVLQSSRTAGGIILPHSSDSTIQVVRNPTLLNERELKSTMKQFVGKVDSQGSYRDMAQNFAAHSSSPHSYQKFKYKLFEYLISSVDPKFGQCRFNEQLRIFLENLYPESNNRQLNDFLLVRTCNQLMNFLVIDSRQRPNHRVFMDLLNNVGSTATIGLMLKVVLVCKKTKPYLEKRFSILFDHYESHRRSAVQWLVRCLEKVNLAWSTHFSKFDFSFLAVL